MYFYMTWSDSATKVSKSLLFVSTQIRVVINKDVILSFRREILIISYFRAFDKWIKCGILAVSCLN